MVSAQRFEAAIERLFRKKALSDSSFDQGSRRIARSMIFTLELCWMAPHCLLCLGLRATHQTLTLNHMSSRRVNLVSRVSLKARVPVGLAQHGQDLQAQPLPHALRTRLGDSDVCHYYWGASGAYWEVLGCKLAFFFCSDALRSPLSGRWILSASHM